jgi:transposase
MYLRTTKRTTSAGAEVEYYYLAHNHRDPDSGVSKAQIIHSFGRADQVDREELVRLCTSIARVCGVEVHDPVGEQLDLEKAAGTAGVLPKGVRRIETRPLGVVHVAQALWERLGIGPALRKIVARSRCTVPYERALLAMTANRLDQPCSKLGVWDRWLQTVHLPSCEGLKLDHMYEAMDVLHKHAAEVEEAVFLETAELFNLEVDVVFYDTTTCSFSIDAADDADDEEDGANGLRQFGRAKEGGWTPQVVVALAVTREGLPVRSWVFPGNKTDVKTVERVKRDLRGWKLGRALFVADSGMNSADNRQELVKACGRYLLAMRSGAVSEVQEEVLSRAGRYKRITDSLWAKEVVVGEGVLARRYIVCFNPSEAKRQRLHREQALDELREELQHHRDRDATRAWAMELKASGRYGRYVQVDEEGKLLLDRAAVRKAQRMDGKWVLLTNDDTLSLDDAASAYKGLLVIERCFRALKRTQVQMTPMWHWLPRRIEAHVKICVLALLLERVAERATGRSWPMLRHELNRLQATEYATDSHRFFERNEPATPVREILKRLAIPMPKLVLDVREIAAET